MFERTTILVLHTIAYYKQGNNTNDPVGRMVVVLVLLVVVFLLQVVAVLVVLVEQ